MKQSKAVPNEEKPVRGKLLTMEEAEERSTMSKEWIYSHMKAGTLPFPWFFLSPGKRRIDSADIDDWLRNNKIPVGKKLNGTGEEDMK